MKAPRIVVCDLCKAERDEDCCQVRPDPTARAWEFLRVRLMTRAIRPDDLAALLAEERAKALDDAERAVSRYAEQGETLTCLPCALEAARRVRALKKGQPQ
jgi:hypothetical protein